MERSLQQVIPRRVPPILVTTIPQHRARAESFTGDLGSQGLIRRDLNAYLEQGWWP